MDVRKTSESLNVKFANPHLSSSSRSSTTIDSASSANRDDFFVAQVLSPDNTPTEPVVLIKFRKAMAHGDPSLVLESVTSVCTCL